MNLIIIFDNYTYNNNTFVLNTIKRWISYKINNALIENIYEKIILIKTCPIISKFEIKKSNFINENILNIINGVIYKKYINYPTIIFKQIVDELNNYKDSKNKIIIISSIYYASFTYNNINYINDILSNLNEPIHIINIGVFSFKRALFKNIVETIIDIRINKLENIITNEIFTIKKYDYNMKFNEDKELKLSDYLILLENIEFFIINNINDDNELIIIDNTLKKINYLFLNVKYFNIIGSYINYINRCININFKKLDIDIPINKLDNSISDTYIKYILEFYEEIYPKILNNYIDMNIKNYKIKTNINTSLINCKNLLLKKINIDDINDDSKNFLISNLSMSNWIDEFNELNPFGILINYDISKFSYKGLIDENSSIIFNYPNMIIDSISNNWVSMYDYYQLIISDLNNDYEKKTILNLNSFNIIDNLNGNTNVMLPIYINKEHWKLCKSLWTYHMSFINNSFEYEYVKKMDNIYYLTLFKNYSNLIENSKLNNNTIRVFIYILRTCIQISIDNKYISNLNNIYFNSIISKDSKNKLEKIKLYFIDYLIRLIQLIISFNIDIDIVKSQLKEIRNIILNTYIKEHYTTEFWNNLIKIDDIDKNNQINILKYECIDENKSWFELEINLITFTEFITKIYKLKNFNQFIKLIDSYNGCIPINDNSFINYEIINNIFINLENTKNFNINNYINEINIDSYLISNNYEKID
jgi:hypothetical protein